MKYTLVRNTKNPSRGHVGDAGIDIYVPKFTNQFIEIMSQLNEENSYWIDINQKRLYIAPHKRIKLPTGVHFNVPEDNMLMVLEKTSIPNKTGIISGARVIDAGYTGEFIASLINTSSISEFLQEGQKFIQLVLVPINSDYSLEKIQTIEQLYENKNSTRKSGAFGSTGYH